MAYEELSGQVKNGQTLGEGCCTVVNLDVFLPGKSTTNTHSFTSIASIVVLAQQKKILFGPV